jgi:hypothetical protein
LAFLSADLSPAGHTNLGWTHYFTGYVWDIISDNHDVTGTDDRRVDIGSFRGAGGFIAGRLNRESLGKRYDYLDFYMGTMRLASRADLYPVYRLIFQRMKSLSLEWSYCFPRLGPVTFGEPAETDAPIDTYDPSDSLRKEGERRQKAEELADLEAELEEGYRESAKEAQEKPPPTTVQSYRAVYGHLPQGWPPSV